MAKTLDLIAIDGIRAAVGTAKGKALAERVRQLAAAHQCSPQQIYRVTEDLRTRKKRADQGKRKASIFQHPGLQYAAELCVNRNVPPMLALETARANGYETPITEETFMRYLREAGIGQRQRRATVRPHRRFEASAPCEMFEFDMTGFKERYYDLKTRKLLHVSTLDVSKNHQNESPNRVKVWGFALIDDYSRYKYVRFYALDKPSSYEVVDFLLGAFREMGVPRQLYTDNDKIIISRLMRRAERILNNAFIESGGFELTQHAAGNPQATGKVERTHQTIEKFETLVGLKVGTGEITLERINEFAANVCERLNAQPHRSTGEKPVLRFRHGFDAKRVPPPATLDSAFKCKEFTRRVREDLTISYEGEEYQLPRQEPFTDLITKTLEFVWPADAAANAVAIIPKYSKWPNGGEVEFARKLAKPDAAGEFKAVAENQTQVSTKFFKESFKARQKAEKEAGVQTVVPGWDVPFESAAEPQPAQLPRPVIEMPVTALPAGALPPSATETGRWLKFWPALRALTGEGALTIEEVDKDWLRAVFAGRAEIAEGEIRAALEQREPHPIETNVLTFRRSA